MSQFKPSLQPVAVVLPAAPAILVAEVPAPKVTVKTYVDPAKKVAFALLAIFVFLLFGRLTDLYFWYLHLPLIFSVSCLLFVPFSGNVSSTLSSRIGKSLLLLTVWFFAAVPLSFWRADSLDLLTNIWLKSLMTFVLIGCLTFSLDQTMHLIRIIACSLLLTAVMALTHGVVFDGRLFLPQGLYSGPNEVAGAMVLGCIYWWFIVHDPASSTLRKALGFPVMVFMLYVMGKTGSRAALVALAVVAVAVFRRYSAGQRIIFLVIVALLGLGSLVFVPDSLRSRYYTFLSVDQQEDFSSAAEFTTQMQAIGSTSARLYYLRTSLMLTLKNPIFGVGPNQFASLEHVVAVERGALKGKWQGTHNSFTQVSSEAGIPALAFYIACLVFCWKDLTAVERGLAPFRDLRARSVKTAARTLRLALLCYMVFNCFEHVAYSHFLPSLAGLIVAFSRGVRQEYPIAYGIVPDSPAA